MSTIPKRVQIELKSLVDGYPILSLYHNSSAGESDDRLSASSYSGSMHVMLSIRDAHAAREYAVALHGAAEALVEWAQAREAESNARAEAGRC